MRWAGIGLGAVAGGAAGLAIALAFAARGSSSILATVGGALLLSGAGLVSAVLFHMPPRALFGGAAGLLAGLLAAALLASIVPPGLRELHRVAAALVLTGIALGWLGMLLGAGKGAELGSPGLLPGTMHRRGGSTVQKLLDTSVIIDGRIEDLCATGFVEGILIVPQFVLRELQYIADSPEALKRNRGRRGLDVLARMQKKSDLDIVISDEDFPRIREVDAKLIALAQKVGAKIVTNDFNLNKVAELNGVPVLNINQVANALRPVVLPGEPMRVTVLKEGKEANQGVGYLDDGTMVVVDNARRFIGKPVEAVVTSVLQTTAGKMIFTQLREPPTREPVRDTAETPGNPAS